MQVEHKIKQTAAKPAAKSSRCPRVGCGSDQVSHNGNYETKYRGRVRRFVCRACGNAWKQIEGGRETLSEVRVSDVEENVLRAFALVAIGLPLDQVEHLVNQKAETISDRLVRCFGKPATWQKVAQCLVKNYGIQEQEIKALASHLDQVMRGVANFHALARRQGASKIRAPRRLLQRLNQKTKEMFRHSLFRRLSDGDFELEMEVERRRRADKTQYGEATTKPLQLARDERRRRVEKLMNCPVILAPKGGFYAFQTDRRIARWYMEVKRFDPGVNGKCLKLLSPTERRVFDYLHGSRVGGQCPADLEGGHEKNPLSASYQNLTALTNVSGFSLGQLVDMLKSIAQILRTTRSVS